MEWPNPIELTKGYISPDCRCRPPIARRDDLRSPTDAPVSKNLFIFALDTFELPMALNFADGPNFSKLVGRRKVFKLNREFLTIFVLRNSLALTRSLNFPEPRDAPSSSRRAPPEGSHIANFEACQSWRISRNRVEVANTSPIFGRVNISRDMGGRAIVLVFPVLYL